MTGFATIIRESPFLIGRATVATMIENRKLAEDPFNRTRLRRCPHCSALSRLTHSLLDSQNGNTVHVYRCMACGRRIWDEGPGLRARLH